MGYKIREAREAINMTQEELAEKSGVIINDFLTCAEVNMLLTMPEGTQDVTVTDNIRAGAVIQFFIVLNAIEPICKAMREQMGIGADTQEWKCVVDALLGQVRNALLPQSPEEA